MQKLPSFLLCAFLLGAPGVPGLGQGDEIDVDELVAGYVEARGGADVLKRIETVRQTGSFLYNGEVFPLKIYHQRPDRYRLEIALPKRGKVSVEAYDGNTGWRENTPTWKLFAPEMELAPLAEIPADELRARIIEDEADFEGPLINYKAKGNKVEYVGTDAVDGAPVHHLRVTLKSGSVQNWFLDQKNSTLLKRTTPQVDFYLGPYERVWYTMDYRPVSGMLFPYYSDREDVQFVRSFEIDKIEVNVELDDSLFTIPQRDASGDENDG